MDSTAAESSPKDQLPRHDDDHDTDKATTINHNENNNVAAAVAMEQVIINNNPTTSGGTSGTNNVIERRQVPEEEEEEDDDDGEKCIENINNISDKIDDQQDDYETNKMSPTSPTMMIVKGKRTKRQRIHSPVIGENKCTNNQQDINVVQIMTDDDEEMDMANCLILLAQGPSRPPLIRRNELGLFTSNRGSAIRFTSENKRVCYNNSSVVYECKTCNRTFPSFQALGGHRASHKKLKITTTTNTATVAETDQLYSQMVTLASPSPSPLSLQLGNINYLRSLATGPSTPTNFVAQNNILTKRNRVHECATCGAEFSSGQALGGHMRRHRGTIMPLNSSTTTTTTATNTTNKQPFANTTLSLSTAANNVAAVTAVESKVINRMNDGFLSLDLNLPASSSPCPIIAPPINPRPTEHDDDDETNLSKQQQPQTSSGMVLSSTTPALVDCFY